MKPTPYQRIMRAAQAGRGVLLTPGEVLRMSCDDAISTVAWNDDEGGADDTNCIRCRAPDVGGHHRGLCSRCTSEEER